MTKIIKTHLCVVTFIAALCCFTPLDDELQQHLDSIVQQSGMDISYLPDYEVRKP